MATMIPSVVDESTHSKGERRVFDLLRLDPDTAGWVVLHALGLAERGPGLPFGEIDFVVIVPGLGIVCLEVKGGRIRCVDGVWIAREGEALRRGPLMQARASAFALKKAIERHLAKDMPEARCLVAYGVAFPDVECPPVTPEFDREEAIDREDLRQPISRSIKRVLKHQLRHLVGRAPSTEALARIRAFLRPNFDLVVKRSHHIGRAEESVLTLTEEQYRRLDELGDNPRCLFEGAAGTGKTLLAAERARRAAATGRRTLLLCYNRLLGRWLAADSPAAARDGLVVGSFHGLLYDLVSRSSLASELQGRERNEAFFEDVLPLAGELAIEELGERFDHLIVDEAQDLVHPRSLDVLDRWLAGGLAGGDWVLFGDFTRQALFGQAGEGLRELSRRSPHFARARLTQNCRNTQRIAVEMAILSGFPDLPFTLTKVEGLPVEYHFWKRPADQLAQVERSLTLLMEGGVREADIILLGTRRLQNSCLTNLKEIAGRPIFDLGRIGQVRARPQQSIAFSTVQAFKGMEAPAVLFLDVDAVEPEHELALLYVGMSRARSSLALFVSEKARAAVEARRRGGLAKAAALAGGAGRETLTRSAAGDQDRTTPASRSAQ